MIGSAFIYAGHNVSREGQIESNLVRLTRCSNHALPGTESCCLHVPPQLEKYSFRLVANPLTLSDFRH